MFHKPFLIFTLIILFSASVFSQATESNDKKKELEAQAVEFLKSTSNEIGLLRTPENRISFNSELAALMWFHDEKQARQMFGNVITDFRQMLVQIDAQLNAYNIENEGGAYYNPFARPSTPKAKLLQKFRKAMGVRRQIASAVAEHDAILALEFYDETGRVISNPKLRAQNPEQDSYFVTQLLEKVAEQNPDKILEYARKSLDNGVGYNTFRLLEKIYKQNAKDGAAFGEAVFSKIKEGKVISSSKMYFLDKVTGYGNKKTETGKPPVFSSQIIREAAELLALELLSQTEDEDFSPEEYLENIEKYAPGRAAQVRQKFNLKKSGGENKTGVTRNAPPPPPPASSPGGRPETGENPVEMLEKLKSGKMSADEKRKFIADARQKVAEIEDPMMKIMMLSQLAAQLSNLGEKEIALELLREAEAFHSHYPKNYLDYLQNYMLASGYAEVEPEKAFPVLESSIVNLNETISAFIKVGEFIDVGGEFIEEGEVQVGVFGGGLVSELMSGLGQSEGTVRKLAEADFQRTASLANKFDRTELRILARMLILRSIFEKENKGIKTDEIKSDEDSEP